MRASVSLEREGLRAWWLAFFLLCVHLQRDRECLRACISAHPKYSLGLKYIYKQRFGCDFYTWEEVC